MTDVLDRNVETLLETGGAPPRIDDAARARIRGALIASHAAARPVAARSPVRAIAFGLVAVAAGALIVTELVGGEARPSPATRNEVAFADGTSVLLGPGGHVDVVDARHVRITGSALVDVVPGHGGFTVDTAAAEVHVLGTRFVVDAGADTTTAAVVRGEVELSTTAGKVALHAGEQGTAQPGRVPTRAPAPRLTQLVSWAREARPHDAPTAVSRHGTLYARDPNRPFIPEIALPLPALTVDVVVEDQVARVALDQTFHNPSELPMEGMYRFAIPPDAALQRLAMYNAGKLTEAAVVPRMDARRIYEDAVYRRVDPALLEWAGAGRLALRVYPLPPRADKRLIVAYTQSLPKLYDDYTLTVPLPELPLPVDDVAFDIRVRDCAACELSSPAYQLSVSRDGGDAVVHYRAHHAKLGDSLVLRVRDPRRTATLAQTTAEHDSFVLLRAPVELPAPLCKYEPRSWVILDDVSASRDALARHAQADLVDAFLAELDEQDRVSVIAFDVGQRTILPPTRVLDVDRAAVRVALRGEPGGVGATDLGGALTAALAQLPAHATGANASIVYLGDGVITAGPRTLDTLRAQVAGKAQFVGVGVGDGPDVETLDGLAAATGGYATTIDLADDLTWRAFDLVAALHTARITGMTARFVDASGAPIPATAYLRSAQLAEGEQLELVAQLAGSDTPVAAELTGTLDGAPWQRRINFADAAPAHGDAGFLPRLWAQRQIAARMAAKHDAVTVPDCHAASGCPTVADVREARDEAIRKEVVALGTRYFLLSRHTSLLVLEDDAMYARYGVSKGAGQTWAPYALPATIPAPAAPAVPQIAADALLPPRLPVERFATGELERRAEIPLADGQAGGADKSDPMTVAGVNEMNGDATPDPQAAAPTPSRGADLVETKAASFAAASSDVPEVARRVTQSEKDFVSLRTGWDRAAIAGEPFAIPSLIPYDNPFVLGSLRNGRDQAFDDLTEHVPALFPDVSDRWRAGLAARSDGAPAHTIDDAARAILGEARARLPAGVYTWDGVELAVDGARALGWRRTTGDDLVETAAIVGPTWTRRYPELDLAVTRAVAPGDGAALGLAYLPIWIAEPAAWTRWFDVAARGPREVALNATIDGEVRTQLVLAFDDGHRLIAVRDDSGRALVTVTWAAAGPTAATVLGHPIAVGFTAQPVADAAAWAWAGRAPPAASVALPGHPAAYWLQQAAAVAPGSEAWRNAQRQRLVATAAQHDDAGSWDAYRALLEHGGVALGDLVLASSGVARATSDAELARALAPWPVANRPAVVRYLAASHGFRTGAPAAHPAEPGMIGALWALRTIVAAAEANRFASAADQLIALGARADALRLVAATVLYSTYEAPVGDIDRAWGALARGRYRNLAREQQALIYSIRGQNDAAADRLAALFADVDLAALPAVVSNAENIFAASRRGTAGWQLAWASWRDRVLASGDLAHVLSLLDHARRTDDAPRVLARAGELAADDPAIRIQLVQWALANGGRAWAQTQLDDLLAHAPTPALYRLQGEAYRTQDRTVDALGAYEAAEALPAAARQSLQQRRVDFGTILELGKRAALGETGAARDKLVARVRAAGTQWRAIDADDVSIDTTLGEFELAIGDRAAAWRQLSTSIERDPMAGDGYTRVAEALEHEGRLVDALDVWQQAIVLDQTNPAPRLAKAKALFALGRAADGDALLAEIAGRKWHVRYAGVVEEVRGLRAAREPPRVYGGDR